MRRGRRRRVALGIYLDGTGYEAQVRSGRGHGNSRRYPKGTKLSTIKAWQRRRLAEIVEKEPTKPATQRHTLKTAVPDFLKLIPKGRTRVDLDGLLGAWLETPLATKHRDDITAQDVKAQLAAWQPEFAASTINHRLFALRRLYRELDGDDAYNPTDRIRKLKEPDPEPRGVPFALAEAILAEIKDRGGKKKPILETRARVQLQVILFTGLPHAQVKRIKPEHIDWTHQTLLVTPRRKGKGAAARTLPLLPQAVTALKEFDRLNCYGTLIPSTLRRAWDLAKGKVAATLMDKTSRTLVLNLRPYDLRHSFLTEVYRHSGDHRATGELGLHSDDRTTRRYTLGAVSERAQKAIQALQQAIPAGTQAGTHDTPNKP